MKISDPKTAAPFACGAAIAGCMCFVALGMVLAIYRGQQHPTPIDHQLDALRAAQVRSWASSEQRLERPDAVRVVSIRDRSCCMDRDGHMVCASAVQCGGVACRGREVAIPLPCGALAFCGGEDR